MELLKGTEAIDLLVRHLTTALEYCYCYNCLGSTGDWKQYSIGPSLAMDGALPTQTRGWMHARIG